jgi:hypothetical protein
MIRERMMQPRPITVLFFYPHRDIQLFILHKTLLFQ